MNKPEAVGGVNNAVDRLETAINSLDSVIGIIADRLAVIALPPYPEPPQVPEASAPTPAKCELATRIDERAYRLERMTKALRQLNDTLDI